MNVHENARATFHGRVLMVRRIELESWTVKQAAEAAGYSERRAHEWLRRFRAGGEPALHERSSATARKRATAPERVREIERLRREERLSGPKIAARLAMPASTVGAVLRRLGLGRLPPLEPRPPIVRYERERPGELIHIDIKKLGRIEGIGHRFAPRRPGMRRNRGIGWDFLHVCVDDASRLAYTEIRASERKEDAAAFLQNALAWFARHGVQVARVMTDNGSAYRSQTFRQACAAARIRHLKTRPYTPRTNGKAERFIQTVLRECAYAQPFQSSAERAAALAPWTTAYNTLRPHAALKGKSPISRLDMNNLLGNDT
jgi:transposase InsO family protein